MWMENVLERNEVNEESGIKSMEKVVSCGHYSEKAVDVNEAECGVLTQ